jgi:DNA-binding MarR family transcriptional regulator
MEKNLIDLIIELKKRCIQNEERIQTLCKVSLAEYKSILVVDENKKITCNILSKKMGLSPSRGSRVIENLIKKGYLIRMSNPADRRSTVISLSSNGIKVKNQIKQERYNCEKRIRKKLSEREIKLIKEGLKLINKIFNLK